MNREMRRAKRAEAASRRVAADGGDRVVVKKEFVPLDVYYRIMKDLAAGTDFSGVNPEDVAATVDLVMRAAKFPTREEIRGLVGKLLHAISDADGNGRLTPKVIGEVYDAIGCGGTPPDDYLGLSAIVSALPDNFDKDKLEKAIRVVVV